MLCLPWRYAFVLIHSPSCLSFNAQYISADTHRCAQGVAWGWRAKQQAEHSKRKDVMRLQYQLRAQAEELTETRRLLRLQKVETNQAMARLQLLLDNSSSAR
eukprot:COSAG02_NODE_12499_length_1536_cov_1.391093_1_plen_102_part_00